MTPEKQAKGIVDILLGDEEWETPAGTKIWTYFRSRSEEEAWDEFRILYYETDEHKRLRRIMSMMGEDSPKGRE